MVSGIDPALSLSWLLLQRLAPSCSLCFPVANCGKNTWHESYPLNRVLSVQYTIVIYRHNFVHQVSRTYSAHITETFYLLISNSPFPSSPASSNHHSITCFYEFDCLRYFIYMELCSLRSRSPPDSAEQSPGPLLSVPSSHTRPSSKCMNASPCPLSGLEELAPDLKSWAWPIPFLPLSSFVLLLPSFP